MLSNINYILLQFLKIIYQKMKKKTFDKVRIVALGNLITKS